MKSKKMLVLLLVVAMLVMATTTALAAEGDTKVYVDGQQISFDTAPVIVEGTTLVPMRAIFEAIGATVDWNQDTKTATGTKDGSTVSVQIGNEYGYKGSEAIKLLQPAQLINSRTMVPLRFISESLGCDVQWEGTPKTITITTSGTVAQITPPADEPATTDPSHEGETNWSGTYYVTPTGSKYHYLNTCGNGTYTAAAWEEVQRRGLTPCDKCVY